MTTEGFRTSDGIVLGVAEGAPGATTYGIRPEHLHLADDGVEIEVVVIEPTGSETQIVCRLGSQTITGIFRERLKVAPGDKIRVNPDLSVVHLFDASGMRVN
jgi:multiple sugar transport system ATP-binding protein